MFKKFIVVALALLMVFTMIPAAAFATSSANTTISSEPELVDAIDAIPVGGSGEIYIEDLYMGLGQSIYIEGKDVTFNLKGSSLSVMEGPAIFAADSNITINADDESSIISNNSDNYGAVIRLEDWDLSDNKKYQLTVNGGSYISENGNNVLAVGSHCTLVVNGAIVEGGVYAGAMPGFENEPGEIVINSGRFTQDVKDYVAEGKHYSNVNNHYYVRDAEYSDEYLAVIPYGQIVFNYVKPATEEDLWLPVDDFWMEYGEKGFSIYTESFDKSFSTCEVILNEGTSREEVHAVDVIWNYDADIYKETQKYLEKFPKDRTWFEVKDLEFINYLANLKFANDLQGDTLANYSSELKKLVDNLNYTLLVDIRAGSDHPFLTENIGEAKFSMDGVVYHTASALGAKAEHAIYVPDNTGDTPDELIAAAEKRIKDYFGKDIVDIKLSDLNVDSYYKDTLADYDRQIEEAETQIPILKARMEELEKLIYQESDPLLIDQYTNEHSNTFFALSDYEFIMEQVPLDKESFMEDFSSNGDFAFLYDAAGGYIFDVSINESVYYQFVIIKDSSKMVTPTYKTVDFNTKVEINTKDSSIPLDTVIGADVLTSGTEYDRIISALNAEKAQMFDLSLFSNTTGQNITKLENGKFQVRIPIPADFEGTEMTVYYVDASGKTTEHEVTPENGYAVFETDHFSIYTLAVKGASTTIPSGTAQEAPAVPPTGDNNLTILWIGAALVAGTGLTISRKRKEQ